MSPFNETSINTLSIIVILSIDPTANCQVNTRETLKFRFQKFDHIKKKISCKSCKKVFVVSAQLNLYRFSHTFSQVFTHRYRKFDHGKVRRDGEHPRDILRTRFIHCDCHPWYWIAWSGCSTSHLLLLHQKESVYIFERCRTCNGHCFWNRFKVFELLLVSYIGLKRTSIGFMVLVY